MITLTALVQLSRFILPILYGCEYSCSLMCYSCATHVLSS